jgi:arylsulfatase A-like enzyme
MADRPTDVTAVAFYGVDALSHLAWHFMQPEHFPGHRVAREDIERYAELIPRYYEFVDGLVGELVAAAGPQATVVVFSDHGFGPTGNLPWSGGHGRITPGAPLAPDGLLVLAGPRIRPGTLERAHVLDLCPTLLALSGLPVARDMPGRVLVEAIDPEFLRASPLQSIATYEVGPPERVVEEWIADPAGDRDTLERLRKLGYLR